MVATDDAIKPLSATLESLVGEAVDSVDSEAVAGAAVAPADTAVRCTGCPTRSQTPGLHVVATRRERRQNRVDRGKTLREQVSARVRVVEVVHLRDRLATAAAAVGNM